MLFRSVTAMRDTLGVYDKQSRARYTQGRKSVLFAFQMYTQQNLWMLWNNKDMRMRYLLYWAVMGGAMGVIPDDLKNLISGLTSLIANKIYGKPFNLERELRRWLTDYLGEDNAIPPDLILHGASRYGFGVSAVAHMAGAKFVPDVDMSSSLTLNKINPIDLGKLATDRKSVV